MCKFAILGLAGCGCLMGPGAWMPNAQQSVAQATTTGLALYNCAYTRIQSYTIVRTRTYNRIHCVYTAGLAFVRTQIHNAQVEPP